LIQKVIYNKTIFKNKMTSKEDLSNSKYRVSRTQSFTDSFKMGASLLGGLASSNKNIRHLNL
jgi:hypothetical protein